MMPLVTIAIPVYKRLDYLPGALRSVAAQGYPAIELIVSDNGENGAAVEALVAEHYPRPATLRRNPRSVDIVTHFNQLIAAARGEYFTLLSDDDEISPNFVEELAGLLGRYPQATAALARVEAFSEDGERVLGATDDRPLPPELMDYRALLRAWATEEHKFISFTTNMARTSDLRSAGGYPEIDRANGSDNALLLKQSLGRSVAFSPRCTFRHRIHNSSYGKAAEIESLARASRQFLRFLREDEALRALGRSDPVAAAEVRRYAEHVVYITYVARWKNLYRGRLSPGAWARAGFALPFHPVYTRQVAGTLVYATPGVASMARGVRSLIGRGGH